MEPSNNQVLYLLVLYELVTIQKTIQDATGTLGGYWMINSPSQTSADSTNVFIDPGHSLVYQDLLTTSSGRTTSIFITI